MGYRLPTEAELNAERLSWGSNNAAGAFGSPLKLPVGGYRNNSGGALGLVGSYGYLWSSTVSGFQGRNQGEQGRPGSGQSARHRLSGVAEGCSLRRPKGTRAGPV